MVSCDEATKVALGKEGLMLKIKTNFLTKVFNTKCASSYELICSDQQVPKRTDAGQTFEGRCNHARLP